MRDSTVRIHQIISVKSQFFVPLLYLFAALKLLFGEHLVSRQKSVLQLIDFQYSMGRFDFVVLHLFQNPARRNISAPSCTHGQLVFISPGNCMPKHIINFQIIILA